MQNRLPFVAVVFRLPPSAAGRRGVEGVGMVLVRERFFREARLLEA